MWSFFVTTCVIWFWLHAESQVGSVAALARSEKLVGLGYGPSHTWEGYRGHGSCSSTAGVSSALCLQAERLQGVFSRVDLRFFHRCAQFCWGEGMPAERSTNTDEPKVDKTNLLFQFKL